MELADAPILVPVLVGAFAADEFIGPLATLAMVALAIGIGVWLWRRQRGDAMVVTAAGIRPTRTARVFIPTEAIAGIELAKWTIQRGRLAEVTVALSIRLADGRLAMVPPVTRSALRATGSNGLLCRLDGQETWAPLADVTGASVDWTLLTDDEVLAAVSRQVEGLLGGFATPGTDVPHVNLRSLENSGGPWAKDPCKRWRGRAAAPVVRTPAPRSATRTLPDLPEPTDLAIPATYWSKASRRGLIPVGTPPAVRFGETQLTLQRTASAEHISYDQIDGFRVALHPDNRWYLSVALNDGTLHDLPGMLHGIWAGNPLLINNELRWENESTGRTGSLPWGSDDDAVIAARLNAHLRLARGERAKQGPLAA